MRVTHYTSKIIHFLHGMYAGFIALNYFLISVFLYIQFVLYEYVEESKIHDEMYNELKEWAFGFLAGLTLYIYLYW